MLLAVLSLKNFEINKINKELTPGAAASGLKTGGLSTRGGSGTYSATAGAGSSAICSVNRVSGTV